MSSTQPETVTIDPRYDIPSFTNKRLLRDLLKANRSALTLAGIPALLAIAGGLILAAFGYGEVAPRLRACKRYEGEYADVLDYCVDVRLKYTWHRACCGPDAKEKAKERTRERCKKETAGKTVYEYCAGNRNLLSGIFRPRMKNWFFLASLCLGFGLLMGLLWFWGRRRVPSFVTLLRDRPQEVVWIYLMETRNQYGTKLGTNLMLGMANGWKTTVSVASSFEAKAIVENVLPLVAHATFGYDQAKEAQFARDPLSMRRG